MSAESASQDGAGTSPASVPATRPATPEDDLDLPPAQPALKRRKVRVLSSPGLVVSMVEDPTLEDLELQAAAAATESAESIERFVTGQPLCDDEEPGAKKSSAKAGNEFRFVAKHVAGTIARCALSPDMVGTQLLARAGIKNCASELNILVVQELHEDKMPHIHFYIECRGDKKLQIRGNKLSERYPYRMNLKAVYSRAEWIKYLLKEQEEVRLPLYTNDDHPDWATEAKLPPKQQLDPTSLVAAWPWLTEPTIEQALDRYYRENIKGNPKLLAKFGSQVNQLKSLWEIYQRSDAVCKELNERAAWLKDHPFGGLHEALLPLATYIDRYVRASGLVREAGTGQYSRQPVLVISGPLRIGKTMAVLSLLSAASSSSCLYMRGAASPAALLARRTGKLWTLVLDDLRATQPGGPLLPPDKQWTQPPLTTSSCEGKYVREGASYETPAGVIILTNSSRAELIGNWQTPDHYWVDETFGCFTNSVSFVDLSRFSEETPVYTSGPAAPWLETFFARWGFKTYEQLCAQNIEDAQDELDAEAAAREADRLYPGNQLAAASPPALPRRQTVVLDSDSDSDSGDDEEKEDY